MYGFLDIYYIIWSYCFLICEGGINLMMLVYLLNKYKILWLNIEIKYYWSLV